MKLKIHNELKSSQPLTPCLDGEQRKKREVKNRREWNGIEMKINIFNIFMF
jgi:hypothetical protein